MVYCNIFKVKCLLTISDLQEKWEKDDMGDGIATTTMPLSYHVESAKGNPSELVNV